MKEILCLLVALGVYTSVEAQYFEWEVFHWNPDSLVRASFDIRTRPKSLSDTLKVFQSKMYYDKSYCDIRRSDGAAELFFETDDQMDYERRTCYLFPLVLSRPLSDGVRFEIDWMVGYPREQWAEESAWEQYDPHMMYIQGDTIVTATQPCECGGVTPEGTRFRVCGERVAHISARTKCVFNVVQEINENEIDWWGVPLGNFETPWVNTAEGRDGYRLPVIRKLVVDAVHRDRFMTLAAGVQQRYLVDRRDSVIRAGWSGGEEYRQQILDCWQVRLGADFKNPRTLSGMCVEVIMSYFLTEVTVMLKNGRQERYIHVATYTTNIP